MPQKPLASITQYFTSSRLSGGVARQSSGPIVNLLRRLMSD